MQNTNQKKNIDEYDYIKIKAIINRHHKKDEKNESQRRINFNHM